MINATVLDHVLTPKLSLKMTFISFKSLLSCKAQLKERAKGVFKGTPEHKEVIELAHAVHALEKLIDYEKESRLAIRTILSEAVRLKLMPDETRIFLETRLGKEFEIIKDQVDTRYKKQSNETTTTKATVVS